MSTPSPPFASDSDPKNWSKVRSMSPSSHRSHAMNQSFALRAPYSGAVDTNVQHMTRPYNTFMTANQPFIQHQPHYRSPSYSNQLMPQMAVHYNHLSPNNELIGQTNYAEAHQYSDQRLHSMSPTYIERQKMLSDNNRGVWRTPTSADNIDININTLKSIISTTQSIKSESPNSLVNDFLSNIDSKDLMTQLADTDKKANEIKNRLKNDEKDLEKMDAEIKFMEMELNGKKVERDQLRQSMDKLRETEELLTQRRTKLIEAGVKHGPVSVNEVSNTTHAATNVSQMPNYDKNDVINALNEETNNQMTNKPIDAGVKRNTMSADVIPAKKVKTSAEIGNKREELNKANEIIRNKLSNRVARNQLQLAKPTIRPTHKNDESKDGQTPKINRISSDPNVPNKTSGVRTSRPQKIVCSRPAESSNQNDKQKITGDIHGDQTLNESEKVISNEKAYDDIMNIMSDNESLPTNKAKDLDELPSDRSDEQISIENIDKSVCNNEGIQITVLSRENVDSDDISDEKEKQQTETDAAVNEQQLNETPKGDTECSESSDKNNNKSDNNVIEVVDLIDDDEDINFDSNLKIKEEKMDTVSDNNIPKSFKTTNIELAEDTFEDNASNTEEQTQRTISDGTQIEQNLSTNDAKQDQRVEQPTKRPLPIFNGWKLDEYPPTDSNLLQAFRAFSGPKSKTLVVKIMSFKNYLFASFGDYTVRRFSINSETPSTRDVLKYEGHTHLVWDFKAISCNDGQDFHLYTGCQDGKLRRFNLMDATLITCFDFQFAIHCFEYCWNNLYVGLTNGFVAKLSEFESAQEINEEKNLEKYCVARNRKITQIKALRSRDPNVEAILTLTHNKLRVVNTKPSLSDSQRILFSTDITFDTNSPMHMQIRENKLFIASNLAVKFKIETKKKPKEESRLFIYDLNRGWKPIREIKLSSYVTAMELNKHKYLTLTCFRGEIRCIDCDTLDLHWMAYHNGVITGAALVGNRLAVGNEEGKIGVVYLDDERHECDQCYTPFAREMDLKYHIMVDHKVVPNDDELIKKSDLKEKDSLKEKDGLKEKDYFKEKDDLKEKDTFKEKDNFKEKEVIS